MGCPNRDSMENFDQPTWGPTVNYLSAQILWLDIEKWEPYVKGPQSGCLWGTSRSSKCSLLTFSHWLYVLWIFGAEAKLHLVPTYTLAEITTKMSSNGSIVRTVNHSIAIDTGPFIHLSPRCSHPSTQGAIFMIIFISLLSQTVVVECAFSPGMFIFHMWRRPN